MRGTVLLAPQLFADGVGHDLVPVDLGSRHRQLSSKSLTESVNDYSLGRSYSGYSYLNIVRRNGASILMFNTVAERR